MNQTWENGKKPSFWTDFSPFGSNVGKKRFFYMLGIVPSYHCMQFQRQLINQIWENGKKLSLGTDFGLFDPNLGHQKFLHRFYFYTC